MVIIDTSIWIEYFRGRRQDIIAQVELLIAQRQLRSLSLINAELIRGCLSKKEIKIIEDTVGKIPILPINDFNWESMGLFAFRLARKGLSVSLIDGAIAYMAIENHCSLLTGDKDFSRIAKYSELSLMRGLKF